MVKMELRREILEKYIRENPNATQLEIAGFFGVSVTTINKKILEYRINYKPKTGKRTKIKEENVKKYLEDFPNATIEQIASAFNVSNATISRFLRIKNLASNKRILRGPTILKQDLLDYINLNPKATRIQMSNDLQMSMSVLNMHLKKFGIEWDENEEKFVSKEEFENEEKIEELPEEEEVILYKVKKEDVEECIRKHPKATRRDIAAYLSTTEEKLDKYMKKHQIDFEKIQDEKNKEKWKQQESKEKFIDKVIKLLEENPNATPEKVKEKIKQKYGKELPVRRLLELRRLELIKSGNTTQAKEILEFLKRGTDKYLIEEIVEELQQNQSTEDDGER